MDVKSEVNSSNGRIDSIELLASLKSCRQREKLKVMVDAMAAEVMLKLPQSTVLTYGTYRTCLNQLHHHNIT